MPFLYPLAIKTLFFSIIDFILQKVHTFHHIFTFTSHENTSNSYRYFRPQHVCSAVFAGSVPIVYRRRMCCRTESASQYNIRSIVIEKTPA